MHGYSSPDYLPTLNLFLEILLYSTDTNSKKLKLEDVGCQSPASQALLPGDSPNDTERQLGATAAMMVIYFR